jgi:hypothetical protein
VIVIDTSTDKILHEITLQCGATYAKNPTSKFVFASSTAWSDGSGHNHLFIVCSGQYNSDYESQLDGGIIAIDTTTFSCVNWYLVSESDLQSYFSDLDYANGNLYVVASDPTTEKSSTLFSVSPRNSASQTLGKTTPLLSITSGGYEIPFVKATSTGLILTGDKTSTAPGIWIFDSSDNSKKNSTVISTYSSPYDITLTD